MDEQDLNTRRCSSCGNEIVDAECTGCGREFSDLVGLDTESEEGLDFLDESSLHSDPEDPHYDSDRFERRVRRFQRIPFRTLSIDSEQQSEEDGAEMDGFIVSDEDEGVSQMDDESDQDSTGLGEYSPRTRAYGEVWERREAGRRHLYLPGYLDDGEDSDESGSESVRSPVRPVSRARGRVESSPISIDDDDDDDVQPAQANVGRHRRGRQRGAAAVVISDDSDE